MRWRAGMLMVLSLGLAACQPALDPKLLVGTYQASDNPVQGPADKGPSSLTSSLKLSPNDQDNNAPMQKGFWTVSGNELTLTLLKLDPATMTGAKGDHGGRSIVDATLKLRVDRSTRTLWLEESDSTEEHPKGLKFIRS